MTTDQSGPIKPPRVWYVCGCIGYETGPEGAPARCPDHDAEVKR